MTMTMTRLWLVTLLSLLCVQGLLALPLGVHPNEAGKYSGDSFKCGAVSIKSSQINDNYCDCADGSDEPGTNACANSKFWCVNRGYIGKYVFSSFVNDGICDCCDGSDESSGPNACENTCMNVGSAHRKKMYEDLKRFREGAAIKQKWIEYAKENRGTGDVSIQAEKEAVEILNQQYDALCKQVDNLKGALKKARKLIEEIDRTKERIDDEADSNNRAFVDEDDDDEKEETEQELSLQDRLSIFQEARGKTPQELVDEHNKVKRERDDLRSKLNDAQSKLKSAEKLQALNFGPDDAFYYLYDKTFELRHPQYTYTLRPFFEVKQAHTTIGEFEGWSDDTFTTQLYKRGQRCWGIGERETSIKYECGSETKIIAVDEPSPCVYAMTVETPAACNVEAIHKVLQDLGLSEEKLKEEFEKTNGLFNWVW